MYGTKSAIQGPVRCSDSQRRTVPHCRKHTQPNTERSHQSRTPVGTAPPNRSQLKLQRHTQSKFISKRQLFRPEGSITIALTNKMAAGKHRNPPNKLIKATRSGCSPGSSGKQTNKQKFKVRQPERAARSKRPNTPSDGSKNNGIHTTKQEEYPSRHPTTDTANKSPAGD